MIHLAKQYGIPTEELVESQHMFFQFMFDFEESYYQCNPDRIHFVRQSVHLVGHIPSEIVRLGPLSCYTQYTIENLIGNLGQEIGSLVKYQENLANRAILRAQMNCLTAMYPHIPLDDDNLYPKGASDLGNGYALLRVRDETAYSMSDAEAEALQKLWTEKRWPDTNFGNAI